MTTPTPVLGEAATTATVSLEPESRSETLLRPRFEGTNICTWIGFKHDNYLVEEVKRQVGWIALVTAVPGEFELEALAAGALRVLRYEEEALDYTGIPTFTGFDHLKRS